MVVAVSGRIIWCKGQMPGNALLAIGTSRSILSHNFGIRLGRSAYDYAGRVECSEWESSS